MKTSFFKLSILLLVSSLMVSVTSCKNNKSAKKVEASEAQTTLKSTGGDIYTVSTDESTIKWQGFKPGGSHTGTLAISKGEMEISDEKVLSGSFEIDMNSIVCTDLEAGSTNDQLVGHLKSADFFEVEKFPKGEFSITSVEMIEGSADSCLISGNLILKDVEKNVSFKSSIEKTENGYKAVTEKFLIDRTQWGVNYGSKNIFKNLKDNMIDDEMEIQIEIVVNK